MGRLCTWNLKRTSTCSILEFSLSLCMCTLWCVHIMFAKKKKKEERWTEVVFPFYALLFGHVSEFFFLSVYTSLSQFAVSAFIECKFYAHSHSHRYFICSSITLIICVISCPPNGKRIAPKLNACIHTYIIGNFSSSSRWWRPFIYRFPTARYTYTVRAYRQSSENSKLSQAAAATASVIIAASIITAIHKKNWANERTSEQTNSRAVQNHKM